MKPTQTTQDNFHPFLGHVIDGCEVRCANGDLLKVANTMRGWVLTKDGAAVTTPTNDAWVLTEEVIGYGQALR